jgi:hypothetical protein
MKSNPYYSLNKSERALQILFFYGTKAVVIPYINLRYTSWDGTEIKMEFSSAVVVFKPPTGFEVKGFLEGIREHWIFEMRDEANLEIEVYLVQMNLDE